MSACSSRANSSQDMQPSGELATSLDCSAAARAEVSQVPKLSKRASLALGSRSFTRK